MTSEEQAKWFYIDDFFIWLGCKFVTCDKDAPKEKPDQKLQESKMLERKDAAPPAKENESAMREAAIAKAK